MFEAGQRQGLKHQEIFGKTFQSHESALQPFINKLRLSQKALTKSYPHIIMQNISSVCLDGKCYQNKRFFIQQRR